MSRRGKRFALELFGQVMVGVSGCVLIGVLRIPWATVLMVASPLAVFGWGTAVAVIDFLLVTAIIYAVPEKVRNWTWGDENKRFLAFHSSLSTAQEVVFMAVTAVGEEIFFRGVVQSLAFELWSSPAVAIGTSALFFALVHFRFIQQPFLLGTGIVSGAFWGWLFCITGTIWASAWAHFLFNMGLILLSRRAAQAGSWPGWGEDAPGQAAPEPGEEESEVLAAGGRERRSQGFRILAGFVIGLVLALVMGLALIR